MPGATEAQAYWAARWATYYLGGLLVSGLPADQMLEQARTHVAWWRACAALAAERTPAPA